MSNLRRSRLVQLDPPDASAPPRPDGRRWALALALAGLAAALLALAWFDGGEEPLHPIAQAVAVPGAAR